MNDDQFVTLDQVDNARDRLVTVATAELTQRIAVIGAPDDGNAIDVGVALAIAMSVAGQIAVRALLAGCPPAVVDDMVRNLPDFVRRCHSENLRSIQKLRTGAQGSA